MIILISTEYSLLYILIYDSELLMETQSFRTNIVASKTWKFSVETSEL